MSGVSVIIPHWVLALFRKTVRFIPFCLICGFILYFISPSATLSLDPEERWIFWLCFCLLGGLGILLVDTVLNAFQIKSPRWVGASLETLGGIICITIPLYQVYDAEDLPSFGFTVFYIGLIMALLVMGKMVLTSGRTKLAHTPPLPEKGSSPEPQKEIMPATPHQEELTPNNSKPSLPLSSRLPTRLRSAEIYALSAEDHYVRVHTSNGEALILIRFSDAILEAESQTAHVSKGLKVHRSWWVAEDAIEAVKKTGRSAEITLKNQTRVPVSRNSVSPLKEMGWLK
jgi:hypothetical protein